MWKNQLTYAQIFNFIAMDQLRYKIEEIWEDRSLLISNKQVIYDVIELIDTGRLRVAEKSNGIWQCERLGEESYSLVFPKSGYGDI